MKKALIICSAGMSSSIFAKRTTQLFASEGKDVMVEARTMVEGERHLRSYGYDLCLVSPQAKPYLKGYQKLGEELDLKVIAIPASSYVPIEKCFKQVKELIDLNLAM